MYKIYFYKDKKGKEPVAEYIRSLCSKNDKNSRINANKINDYVEMLSRFGTAAGEPFVKHICDNLWELRPLRNRIFFVAWTGDSYVLLHHFIKKTRKTPQREIDKALREIESLNEGDNYEQSNWK